MPIRPEHVADIPAVRAVNVAAFETSVDANLVDALREQARPIVSLVAEDEAAIVGHGMFSPATLVGHTSITLAIRHHSAFASVQPAPGCSHHALDGGVLPNFRGHTAWRGSRTPRSGVYAIARACSRAKRAIGLHMNQCGSRRASAGRPSTTTLPHRSAAS